jgi:RNA polymerase-associated protein CTR9
MLMVSASANFLQAVSEVVTSAKVRQAQMLANLNRANDAHELLKQALASQNGNLNLRAFYTYFLIQSNIPKIAKDFVFTTLKDHDKYDVYSLCAAGWIHYHQSRESRDVAGKAVEERKRGFQRSAEFFEKALQHDPMCLVAAQGLAIVIAEDALGTLGGSLPPGPAPDDGHKRLANAREALDVFAKIRESTNDGSVYINMGHCYYARDEYDRAIESVCLLRICTFLHYRPDRLIPISTRPHLDDTMMDTTFQCFYAYADHGMRRRTGISRSPS